jgi:hypothetical protein
MKGADSAERHASAVKEFNEHERRSDGTTVAGSLASGLDRLRESFYLRVHHDVERALGVDSMWMPLSELRAERQTKREIDIYQIAESAATVRDCHYLADPGEWYLPWLCRFRLGDAHTDVGNAARLADYAGKTLRDRRLAFSDVLGEVLRESRRAPLVLFRLMPSCVEIATALAFGDHARARDARKRQIADLPAIRYCNQCRGDVLENGEQCRGCGNPLWKYDWLTATD